MVTFISKQFIFSRMFDLVYSIVYAGRSYYDLRQFESKLFVDGEFAPKYGFSGYYNTIDLLEDYGIREKFDIELDYYIRLVSTTQNYLYNYCNFLMIEPELITTPLEFIEVSPNFDKAIIELFIDEIESICRKDISERLKTTELAYGANGAINDIMINALQRLYFEETGEMLSKEHAIEMLKQSSKN